MIFFTIPRAFQGLHKIHQENALNSWTRLKPRPEIWLFCDDPGIKDAAKRFGCKYVPDIERHLGVPLIGRAFEQAQQATGNKLLCYLNADIILMQDAVEAFQKVAAQFSKRFLVIGRKWDIDLKEPLDFSVGWQDALRRKVRREGKLHEPTGLDFFAFRRGTIPKLPQFIVGSPRWDTWILETALKRKTPVVDASRAIYCVHQHFRRPWPAEGKSHNWRVFWKGAKSRPRASWTTDATWILDGCGLRKK